MLKSCHSWYQFDNYLLAGCLAICNVFSSKCWRMLSATLRLKYTANISSYICFLGWTGTQKIQTWKLLSDHLVQPPKSVDEETVAQRSSMIYSLLSKSSVLKSDGSGFQFLLCCFLVMWPWENYINSMNLICKVGIEIILAHRSTEIIHGKRLALCLVYSKYSINPISY